jgi:Flavodoxin
MTLRFVHDSRAAAGEGARELQLLACAQSAAPAAIADWPDPISDKPAMPEAVPLPPRRVLVACYSLNGHTRRLAVAVARTCGADIETITDSVHRQGMFGHLRSSIEAWLHLRPSLRASRCSPRDYELVVVCTPVWAWNMASPVRSWLHRHRGELPQVALVCTYGGSGYAKVLQDLQRLCGKPPVARLALSAERIEQKTYPRRLQDFADRLREALPAAPPAASRAA